MKKGISKIQAKGEIEKFFSNIQNKTPKEIEKIKNLAKSHKICMKNYKKSFCKKCFTPYKNPKIRIKNKLKSVLCKNCRYVARYNLNSS